MVNSSQLQRKITFKLWPKGFKTSVFFKNYFSHFPDTLPIFPAYSYNANFKSTYSSSYRFRAVVVRATKYGYISDKSIEAFRKVIAPLFRKKGYYQTAFLINVFPHMPLTKKPAEVRMGGGKGAKLRGFFSPVRPGQILFTVLSLNPSFSLKMLAYASRKLPISTTVFIL